MKDWNYEKSEELYNVERWGQGYFSVNDRGHLEVRPEGPRHPEDADGSPLPGIDLFELLGQLRRRGVESPILLRFDGVLRSRVRDITEAFERAIEEYDFEGTYRAVYPIKVNQQRHVVEALLEGGRTYRMGLEAGSKPELLAVMALFDRAGPLVVCNGYKDREYIETALLASKLGMEPVLVLEKFSEIEAVLAASERLGIPPTFGVRIKLSAIGSGRWMESGGDRSKFGLTTRQVVLLVERLREAGMLDRLQMLHFHLGSQITHIRNLKAALREATRTFVELSEMGAKLRYFDAGGGLGIDYDGSNTDSQSSRNYSLQEYANDIVYHLAEACTEAGLPAPEILTESGRALTAHHAVLVTEVLGKSELTTEGPPDVAEEDEADRVQEIAEICSAVNSENFQESYHDVIQMRDEAMTLFRLGELSLSDRARVEEFYWRACEKILRIIRRLDFVPTELEGLERTMADTYYLNFSVFQSMPDSWAIEQLFPVLPIHRLDEEPTRRGVLADITCDSDGRIDRFIDPRGPKPTLELHPLRPGEPYYLGHFLVGAYQEILGDMHNLFGDTNVVHVDLGEDGRPKLTHVVPGDRVQEVLSYVEYFETDLVAQLRRHIERALEDDRLTFEESALLLRRYEAGLSGYTYLTSDRDLP